MTEVSADIKEAINLLRKDRNLHSLFFSEIETPRWFLPLDQEGYFIPPLIVIAKEPFISDEWPQFEYLSKLCAQSNSTDFPEGIVVRLLEIFRAFDHRPVSDFAGARIFSSFLKLPLNNLTVSDIDMAFKWLNTKSIVVGHSIVELSLHFSKSVILDNKSRKLLNHFFYLAFEYSKHVDSDFADSELTYLNEYQVKEFKKALSKESYNKALIDIIAKVALERLINLISAKDVDNKTQLLRPAIEHHEQNNHKNSAVSNLTDIFYSLSILLIDSGGQYSFKEIIKRSNRWLIRRIYVALATRCSNFEHPDTVLNKILKWKLSSDIKHEAFHFFKKHFDNLKTTSKDKLLVSIDELKIKDIQPVDGKRKYEAAKKLTWLYSIKNCEYPKAKKMWDKYIKLTDGKEPKHPDFDNYFFMEWSPGPVSPLSSNEMKDLKPEELTSFILSFEDSTNKFSDPSIEGLSRTLSDFIGSYPTEVSPLLLVFSKLHYTYQSSIISALAKSWSEKKFFPVEIVISSILDFMNCEKFSSDLRNRVQPALELSKMICTLVSSLTRNDENAVEAALNIQIEKILDFLIDHVSQDPAYKDFSDAFTRALNEPRGMIFESYIIFSLRKARLHGSHDSNLSVVSASFLNKIDSLIKVPNDQEISLYALLGYYYRHFMFLNSEWTNKMITTYIPTRQQSKVLWTAFFDGFAYVPAYAMDIYKFFRDRGDLLEYLRPIDASENRRRNRLHNRIIELAMSAYIRSDETLENGIVGEILKQKDPEEWQHLSWTNHSFLKANQGKINYSRGIALSKKMLALEPWSNDFKPWRTYYASALMILDVLELEDNKLVDLVFKKLTKLSDSPWDLHGFIDYLHKIREKDSMRTAELFLRLLDTVPNPPSYPVEKIVEILETLSQKKQHVDKVKICEIYNKFPMLSGPIKDFCDIP